MSKEEPKKDQLLLSLQTLKWIKATFDFYSDLSTRCLGYKRLCEIIEEEELKPKETGNSLLSETILPKEERINLYTMSLVEDRDPDARYIIKYHKALTYCERQAEGFKEQRDTNWDNLQRAEERIKSLEETLQIITERYGKYSSDMEKVGFMPDPISIWLNRKLNG
jgi:hypothetical protein